MREALKDGFRWVSLGVSEKEWSEEKRLCGTYFIVMAGAQRGRGTLKR